MKTILSTLALITATVSLVGCPSSHSAGGLVVTEITPKVKNDITACNGGKIDAALEDEIKGLIAASAPNMASADIVKLQENYMTCLKDRNLIDHPITTIEQKTKGKESGALVEGVNIENKNVTQTTEGDKSPATIKETK